MNGCGFEHGPRDGTICQRRLEGRDRRADPQCRVHGPPRFTGRPAR